jgi:hypothetical protein
MATFKKMKFSSKLHVQNLILHFGNAAVYGYGSSHNITNRDLAQPHMLNFNSSGVFLLKIDVEGFDAHVVLGA